MAVDRPGVHRRTPKQPSGLQEDQAKVETGWRTITRGRDRGTFPRPRLGYSDAREEASFLETQLSTLDDWIERGLFLILVTQVNEKNPRLSQ